MEEPFPLLPITSSATLASCSALRLRSTDVFVASYPKSGTTWMQHIVHTLVTSGESPLAHISDACPFFEVDRTWSSEQPGELARSVQANHELLGRRIFNTHLRWEMMPKDGDARYIYMTRDGRDACVSFFHHLSHQAVEDGGFTGGLDQFIADWTSGCAPFGSWSAHLKSWLDGGAATDPRVLIIRYEDLKSNLRQQVLRVSLHLHLELSHSRIDELLPRFTFQWMRENEVHFNPRSVRWVTSEDDDSAEFHFIRQGEVGEGSRRFSASQDERFASMIRRSFPNGVPAHLAAYCKL